ncbi:MAG: hypothetical protein QNJ33_18945 [Crocosphaera sp.]|nr:hypothetical protein [Crocosphaera sp.]
MVKVLIRSKGLCLTCVYGGTSIELLLNQRASTSHAIEPESI